MQYLLQVQTPLDGTRVIDASGDRGEKLVEQHAETFRGRCGTVGQREHPGRAAEFDPEQGWSHWCREGQVRGTHRAVRVFQHHRPRIGGLTSMTECDVDDRPQGEIE